MNTIELNELEKYCKNQCLTGKCECCIDCNIGKLIRINYINRSNKSVFIVDENKQEYNINSEIDYTRKYIYLHINPELLANENCGYYVKIENILEPKEKKYVFDWSNVEEDNETSFIQIDGKYLTSLMTDSPAADYARNLGGFIGSLVQMDFLVQNERKIMNVLRSLNFKGEFLNFEFWTSTQFSHDSAMYYSGFWDYLGKRYENEGITVIPIYDSI